MVKGTTVGRKLGNPVQFTEQNANLAANSSSTNGTSSTATRTTSVQRKFTALCCIVNCLKENRSHEDLTIFSCS